LTVETPNGSEFNAPYPIFLNAYELTTHLQRL